MNGQYDFRHFVAAQAPIFETVCGELRAGKKRSHWMWFIFPQLAGLGESAMSRKFAISSLAEAAAYFEHPLLGPRLRECSRLVAALRGRSIDEIFGFPDTLKFRSSMSLFALAAPSEPVFQECLDRYFAGQPDLETVSRLGR